MLLCACLAEWVVVRRAIVEQCPIIQIVSLHIVYGNCISFVIDKENNRQNKRAK